MYSIHWVIIVVILRFRGKNDQFQQRATEYTLNNSKAFGENEARRVSSIFTSLLDRIRKQIE